MDEASLEIVADLGPYFGKEPQTKKNIDGNWNGPRREKSAETPYVKQRGRRRRALGTFCHSRKPRLTRISGNMIHDASYSYTWNGENELTSFAGSYNYTSDGDAKRVATTRFGCRGFFGHSVAMFDLPAAPPRLTLSTYWNRIADDGGLAQGERSPAFLCESGKAVHGQDGRIVEIKHGRARNGVNIWAYLKYRRTWSET
jgi:hypothetical protein